MKRRVSVVVLTAAVSLLGLTGLTAPAHAALPKLCKSEIAVIVPTGTPVYSYHLC